MRILQAALAGVLVFGMLTVGALAATGNAVGVIPDAEALVSGQTIQLTVGADVDIGQTIRTGPGGQVELLFGEGTKLVVGPDSSLLIEDYLLRTDGGASSFAVKALGGTFRFFTGTLPKDNYKITTPTGTIGIRGTIFELFVNKFGNAIITLLEGGVQLCPGDGSECQELTIDSGSSCSVAFLALSDAGFENFSAETFAEYFPYLKSQETLQEPYTVKWGAQCLEEIIAATTNAVVKIVPSNG